MIKEECEKALRSIALNYDAEYVNECCDDFCMKMKANIATLEKLIKKHFELLKVIERETEYIQKVIDFLGDNFVTVSKLKIAIVELETIQDSLIGHCQDVVL